MLRNRTRVTHFSLVTHEVLCAIATEVTMPAMSIKTKATLLTTAAFVGLLALVSAIHMYRVSADIKKLVGDQQFTLVARVAEEIDERLASRHQALIAVAKRIPVEIVSNARQLENNLKNRPGILAVFDRVFFFSIEGPVLADLPVATSIGINVSDREYLQQTIRTGKPYISEPFLSRTMREPIVMFTAPVLDHRGQVVGILGATLNLLGGNFLGKLGAAKIGNTGGYALLGRNRTIVMSRDKSRIMTPGPAPGISAYFDHATAGQEGWEEGFNNRGVQAVFSYKPLQKAPWVLIAVFPVEEAYAPIMLAQKRIAGVTLILALLLAPLFWFAIRRILSPLLMLRDTIRQLRNDPDAAQEVPIRRQDEIGDVAADFNALMQERRQARAALRESEGRLRAMFEQAAVGMAVLDEHGNYVDANQKLCDIVRYTREELIGMNFDQIIYPADLPATLAERARRTRGEALNYSLDKRYLTKDREPVWVNATATSVIDADGRISHVISVIQDISERVLLTARLAQLAHHDALTGLPNRALFTERLTQALLRSKRSRHLTALMYLDVDRFKMINDTLGHAAGDELLKGFADRVRKCVRASDTVARLGGDEFIILLEDLHRSEESCLVAQKIIDAMQEQFQLGTQPHQISTSIGIAFASDGDSCGEDLIRRADAALYEAKRAGRNRYGIAPPLLTEVRGLAAGAGRNHPADDSASAHSWG